MTENHKLREGSLISHDCRWKESRSSSSVRQERGEQLTLVPLGPWLNPKACMCKDVQLNGCFNSFESGLSSDFSLLIHRCWKAGVRRQAVSMECSTRIALHSQTGFSSVYSTENPFASRISANNRSRVWDRWRGDVFRMLARRIQGIL